MFVYIQTEPNLWTVGFYAPDGGWYSESGHDTQAAAAARVHYLNGGVERETEYKSLTEIQAAVERAARAIATLPPAHWAGWVHYLLEALDADGGASDADFQTCLERTRDGIAVRLKEGRWCRE